METGQAHYSPESGNLNEFSSNVDSNVEKPRVSPQIILVMGSELSGKSVQAGILSRRTNLPLVGAGEAFRSLEDNFKEKVEAGEEVTELERDAYYLFTNPDRAYSPIDLFEKVMRWRFTQKEPISSFQNGFVLEGAPRTKEQFEELERIFNDLGFDMPIKAVYLTVSSKEREARQTERDSREDDAKLQIRLQDHYKDIRFKRRFAKENWDLGTVHTTKKSMREVNEEIVNKLGLDRPRLLRYREAVLGNNIRRHVDWVDPDAFMNIAYDVLNSRLSEREDIIRAYCEGKNDSTEGLNGDEAWKQVLAIEEFLEYELSKIENG